MITLSQLIQYYLGTLATHIVIAYFFITRVYSMGIKHGQAMPKPPTPKDEFALAIEECRKKGFMYYDSVSNYDC